MYCHCSVNTPISNAYITSEPYLKETKTMFLIDWQIDIENSSSFNIIWACHVWHKKLCVHVKATSEQYFEYK